MTGEGPIISLWSYSNCLSRDCRLRALVPGVSRRSLAGAGIVAAVFPEAEGWRAAAGTSSRLSGHTHVADQRILIWAPLTALPRFVAHRRAAAGFRQMVWLCGAVLSPLCDRRSLRFWPVACTSPLRDVGAGPDGVRRKIRWRLPQLATIGRHAVQPIQFVQVLPILRWAPLRLPAPGSCAYVLPC